jgi:2,3-bisphosphoglycerate-dependent phosphoglycerate mutase
MVMRSPRAVPVGWASIAPMTYTLILLRHGESEWNALNLFTGWVDVNLTPKGEAEAIRGGQMLLEQGILPDVAHTSLQKRAIRTTQFALENCERHWVPVRRSWRLNERHYGALQGKDKKETLQQYGEEKFTEWRRSYDVPPPPIDPDDPHAQTHDPRYADLAPEIRPAAECLKDVVTRMLPYWYDGIVPDLRLGRTVLVGAHGNSLRGLVKHLEGMSDEAVIKLNIPTGIPLVYRLDEDLRPTVPGGEYVDPEAAAAAAAAVANQGK